MDTVSTTTAKIVRTKKAPPAAPFDPGKQQRDVDQQRDQPDGPVPHIVGQHPDAGHAGGNHVVRFQEQRNVSSEDHRANEDEQIIVDAAHHHTEFRVLPEFFHKRLRS